jgi:hypothetical protein
MSAWIGPAVVLFMIAGFAFMTVLEIQAMRRNRRWTRVDAIVCADPEHLALKRFWQPHTSGTVMFEGPTGPCVARLGHLSEDGDFPVGSTIRIVFNPANPAEVAPRHSVVWHAVGLVFFGAAVAFLLTLPWRIGVAG